MPLSIAMERGNRVPDDFVNLHNPLVGQRMG